VTSSRFIDQLNEQIAYEFAASQQYVAIAVYYDSLTLPRLAQTFYAQAVEERNHAMMMIQYLLDRDAEVRVPAVEGPTSDFADTVAPVALALEQERGVSDQINGLLKTARDEGDFGSEQFMHWFVKEQVEEVSKMSGLLDVVERARDNPLLAEDYLARETPSEPADPTAPPAAGGELQPGA
jgi:bacterioferritin B